jgi:hypothetical protein
MLVNIDERNPMVLKTLRSKMVCGSYGLSKFGDG